MRPEVGNTSCLPQTGYGCIPLFGAHVFYISAMLSRINTKSATSFSPLTCIFIFVLAVMLLISKDSYLHDLPNHNDSAWFFMCGKAWMNGLTPYVDFADSKGPLLWLIYAIGYLFTPHSFIGVFWLSCVAWTATLWLSWRSALVYLKDNGLAFVAMLFVALAGLQPLVHNETRCEDFAMPFMAYIIYAVCLAAKCGKWNWTMGMGIGVCLAATVLMKYNITMMMLPFAILAWVVAQRRCHTSLLLTAWQAMCGVLMTTLPFLAYFVANGNLVDFIHEYLFVTLHTTSHAGLATATLDALMSPMGLYAVLLFSISAVSMAHLMPSHKKSALACHVLFFAVCSLNARPYYLTIYSPFVVFTGIIIALHCKPLQSKGAPVMTSLMMALLIAVSNLVIHDLRHADYGDFFTQDNAARHDFYAIENIVAKVPQARMVSFVYVVAGVCSDALPACKYWATQTGATPQMMRQQIEACTSGKADFAIVPSECPKIVDEIKKAGWHTYDFSQGPYGILLMSKSWHEAPPKECRVSNVDVILKRDVICGQRAQLTKTH